MAPPSWRLRAHLHRERPQASVFTGCSAGHGLYKPALSPCRERMEDLRSGGCPPKHTHTHIHTHRHAHSYTNMHTYTLIHLYTHIHICTYMYIHTYTYSYINTYKHTDSHIPHLGHPAGGGHVCLPPRASSVTGSLSSHPAQTFPNWVHLEW